jgi:cytochrome c
MLLANSLYAYCGAEIAATNRRDRAFNRQEALCSAPQSLDWSTFLMFLGFSAVPQESERKGADTESGQLTFNNACRTCHTIKKGDNRLGPNLHNIIGRKAGSCRTTAIPVP